MNLYMAKRRKNGEGLLRLRKDGRWEGRVVIGNDVNGKPITKTVTSTDKATCIQKMEAIKDNGEIVPIKPQKNQMSFGEWITHWYENYEKIGLSQSTISQYNNMIDNHIIPEIGSIPINELQQKDLQQFYSRLKTNGRLKDVDHYGPELSDSMVRRAHKLCRMALKQAVKDGIIKNNPSDNCKIPPKKAREMSILTPEEMHRLLIQAKHDNYYELFLLEAATGMRRGEICGLKWDDINLQSGEINISRQAAVVDGKISICTPKTKSSSRTIIIPPKVAGVLREYKRNVFSEWVFPSPLDNEKPRHPCSVTKILYKLLDRIGCKRVRFHDLRHTFATNAIASGMDIKTLSSIIGHISTETTVNIYTHLTDQMKQEAAKQIDSGIGTNTVQNINTKKFEEFKPKKSKKRAPGTGCIVRIRENTYEGRYAPTLKDGSRPVHTVYAKTKEECEFLLREMIIEVNRQIAIKKRTA